MNLAEVAAEMARLSGLIDSAMRLLREQPRKVAETEPEWFDVRIAGWWLWGIACWIGGGWCSGTGSWTRVTGDDGTTRLVHLGGAGRGVARQRVDLGGAGRGVARTRIHLGGAGRGVTSQRAHLGGGECLVLWMHDLAARLRNVRVCSGDWSRILTPMAMASAVPGVRGVFLDPPYDPTIRNKDIYSIDAAGLAADVRAWCAANGDNPNMRIALCGYDGEHNQLEEHGWTVHAWSAHGGMSRDRGRGSGGNNDQERIWFSPACLSTAQARLFDEETA